MTAESHGPWVVAHPDELVATFVIQLPDRLDLPDGTVLPTFEALNVTTVNALEPWRDKLFAYRTDVGALEPLSAIVGDGGAMNWTGVVLQSISTLIHQVTFDAVLRSQLEPSLRLARIMSGDQLTLDQKQEQLAQPLPVPDEAWAEASTAGAGQITIAECAVALRLIGVLPDVDDGPPHLDINRTFIGPAEFEQVHPGIPSVWRWYFVDQIDPIVLERRLREALDHCLGELRDLQRTVHAHRRVPLQLVTTELLPPFIPVVLRTLGGIGQAESPAQTRFVALRPGPDTLPPPRTYSPSELDDLAAIRGQLLHAPFTVHLDLHREACVAIQRQGNARLGALLAGMAAESLLDELLLHLMWEEGLTPEDAAARWRDGLMTRVEREIAPRLRGSWDLTSNAPPGQWAQRVGALRNRVAHTGYTPDITEALQALEAVDKLVTHLCDRLAHQNKLSTYPRTATALAGEQGLARCNAQTKRVRHLQEDPNEPDWKETFSRWKESWRRCRTDLTGQPRKPDPARAFTMLLVDEDGTEQWVVHDRETAMSTTISVNDTDPAVQAQLTCIRAAVYQARAEGVSGRVSMAVTGVRHAPLSPGARWVEQYHHLPLTGVMVDRSDHRR